MKNPITKILCLALLIGSFSLQAQKKSTKEAEFNKLCSEILNAFAKDNIAAVNKYIDANTGIYLITRPGVMDAVIHQSKLDEKKPFSFPYPYKDPAQVKKHKVIFGIGPKYDCGTQKWDKKGFICDTTTKYERIWGTLYMTGKYGGEKPGAEEEQKVKALDAASRRVVYTELNKGKGIVFYMAHIHGKWYLLVIDTVVSSCEA